MNSTETSRPVTQWVRRLIPPLILLTVLTLLVVGITGYFRLSRDARILRSSLTELAGSTQTPWKKRIELHVGPLSCLALRTGLSFAPLDPDARTALRAVRGAEVGIYRLVSERAELDPGALLGKADQRMDARGWDRVVGVAREHELVAVYVPKESGRGATLRVCVAVLSGHQLIVAAGRGDLEPILELARNHADRPPLPLWKFADRGQSDLSFRFR